MRRETFKLVLISSIMSLMVLMLFFAIGEIFSRIYVPASVKLTREASSYFGMMEFDEELRSRVLKKNYEGTVFFRFGSDFNIKTNSLGLRNPEIGEKGDRFRVVFVGDSFTMGYGVNQQESFPEQLREIFDKKGMDAVEIVNAGITGLGTVQINSFLRKSIQALDPDMVVYAFYVNDIIDNYRNETHSSRDIHLEHWAQEKKEVEEYMANRSLLYATHFALQKRSYFYEFFTSRILETRDRWDRNGLASKGWTSVGRIGVHNYKPWPVSDRGASIIDHSKAVEQDMMIHSWKIMSLADDDTLNLVIWRRDEASQSWKPVAQSSKFTASFGLNSFDIEPPLEAKSGDLIGFYTKAGSVARLHPLDNMPRDIRPGTPLDESEPFVTDYSGNFCMRVDGPALNDKPVPPPAVASTETIVEAKPAESEEEVEGDINNGELELLRNRYNPTTQKAYETTIELIVAMRDQVEGAGAQFLVFNIPSYDEVKFKRNFEDRFLSSLEAVHVKTFSVRDRVAQAINESLYLSDSHMNPRGNEVLAGALYEALQPRVSKSISAK